MFISLEATNLIARYILLQKILGIDIDNSSEPFQSFNLLNTIRNELVHFCPVYDLLYKDGDINFPADLIPGKRGERLLKKCDRFILNDYSNTSPSFQRILSLGCAEWSIETSEKIISSLEISHKAT